MSLRTFVFCDACNQEAVRTLEMRRGLDRGTSGGRRHSDGRAWLECDISTAIEEHGWIVNDSDSCLCPECQQHHPEQYTTVQLSHTGEQGRGFIFCDACNSMGIREIDHDEEVPKAKIKRRRILDLRAWYDGDKEHAVRDGWAAPDADMHFCPRCRETHPELLSQPQALTA